jgi:hypothetical protein
LDFRSSFYRHAASVHLCAAHPQLSAALFLEPDMNVFVHPAPIVQPSLKHPVGK